MLRATLALSTLALAAHGCELPCEDDCHERQPRPVQGTPGDFTAGPAAEAAFTVSAAQRCGDDVAFVPTWTHWIEVEGAGARPLTGESAPDGGVEGVDEGDFVSALFVALRDAGRPVHQAGVGLSCGRPGGVPFISTDDWHAAGDIVDAIGERMADDDIGGVVEVRIGRELILCPQVACGW